MDSPKEKTLIQVFAEQNPDWHDVVARIGTKTAAAKFARVTRRTVHNWINGQGEPSFSQGVRLCRAAGIDPLTVYCEDGSEL